MIVKYLAACLLCCSVLLAVGCNSSASPSPAEGGAAVEETPSGESEPDGEATPAPEQGESALMEGLEDLSPEDQKIAAAQKFCPVGGKLGGMGTPVKVEYEGKPYFLCCEHCKEPFLKEPEKYLAELATKQAE